MPCMKQSIMEEIVGQLLYKKIPAVMREFFYLSEYPKWIVIPGKSGEDRFNIRITEPFG